MKDCREEVPSMLFDRFRSFANGYFWRTGHYWLITLVTVIFHFPLVLPHMGMPPWGDFYSFHAPFRIAMAEAVQQWRMPFLTQAVFGGYPMYSDPQFAFFYPVNLLFALAVSNPNSEIPLDAYVLINLVLLSVSAVFFVRSFRFGRVASVAGALVICMNGFVQMHIFHINILQVMAAGLLGCGLLARFSFSDGKHWRLVFLAAFALAASTLAGHPQTTMFLHYALAMGMIFLSVLMLRRSRSFFSAIRILGGSGIAVILGIAMSAVQLLPTAHLIRICTRVEMGPLEAMGEAIRLRHLPSMLFPGFYMSLPWSIHWPFYKPAYLQWLSPNPLESLTFSGVLALGLGLVGFISNIRRWATHAIFLGALLLLAASLGDQTPVYPAMYDYLPAVNVVRVPSRVLWMFYTAWALLAAMGIEAIVRRSARPGALGTLIVAGCGIVAGAIWIVASYRGSWLDAFTAILIENHERFNAPVREQSTAFFLGLAKQAIFGAIFLTLLTLILWKAWRRSSSPVLVRAAIAVMFVELFTYGFGRAYILDVAPVGEVMSRPFEAFSARPKGRGHVPHFVHGGGPINAGVFNGIWIASGYSATYPQWVKAFEPNDVPPWRQGIDDPLLDIWNVSDIVLRRRMTPAKIGPFDAAPVDDWGWTEIGSPWRADTGESSTSVRALMPAQFVINLDDITTPVTQMFTLNTAASTLHLPDGIEVGQMWAAPRDDKQTSISFPLRLGKDLSDSRYSAAVRRGENPPQRHVEVAYVRDALWEGSDRAEMYASNQKLTTPTVLNQLVFTATAPYPAVLGINQVFLVLADDTVVSKLPMEIGDFSKFDSNDPAYHLLRRKTNPGYAWMAPLAIRGSYKDPKYVMQRMLNGGFDPRRDVIVDKRVFPPENAAEVDSAKPDDFKGTATVTWHRPEKLTIRTNANDQGWLVVSMTWDKSWTARVDGRRVELARGNGPHCAIPLPPGRHEVQLSYTPAHYGLGAAISGASLLLCLVGLMWRRSHGISNGRD